MGAKIYSLFKDGETHLSEHFKVKEFRCKDGSDIIKIDDALIVLLEKIRIKFGKAITVTSSYRTKTYNTSIKGAKDSQHLYGTAADIRIAGVRPRDIAEFAETLNPGGLGLYEYNSTSNPGFVHIDVRATRARWLQTSPDGGAKNVSGFGAGNTAAVLNYTKLWKGCTGPEVRNLQTRLKELGYFNVGVTGNFLDVTEKSVMAFQKDKKLVVDGIVGQKTYAALAA